MGLEKVAGYEDLFSPTEWDAIQTGDYSELDKEVELQFPSVSPDGEDTEAHEVTIYDPPGQHAGNEDRFELECDRCGDIGVADTEQEAQALAKLHRTFATKHVATITPIDGTFDVICPRCGRIGSAEDHDLAAMIGRLHEHAFEFAGVAGERAS
ncbi:MAG: hypothetical protein ACRDLB_11920 [Actinomycetota bacterium]